MNELKIKQRIVGLSTGDRKCFDQLAVDSPHFLTSDIKQRLLDLDLKDNGFALTLS